jgi:hypothetical protein
LKKTLIYVAILLSTLLYAQDESYKVVPIVSSNPTSGTGAGVTGNMMYLADSNSSPSQAILTGQYTTTDSYSFFALNKMFFSSDRWQSNSALFYIYNNSSFTIDLPIEIPNYGYDIEPYFDVNIYGAFEQILYQPIPNWYIGGHIFYLSQTFNAKNEEGEFFLIKSGITDNNRGGLGGAISYDTRDKDEKFYPLDAIYANINLSYFPEFMGSGDDFYNIMLNFRDYTPGFSEEDVLATQIFGQYCSENTPDGALSALGARNIIRGFPIGKYKTRYMTALQSEYRYSISNTRFRLTLFGGYANLSGGSKGTELGNRDRDNGDYYSGGGGVHYILSEKYGLDYRLDIAYSSDDETSIYANLNQAF